jgi:hypothetical protein
MWAFCDDCYAWWLASERGKGLVFEELDTGDLRLAARLANSAAKQGFRQKAEEHVDDSLDRYLRETTEAHND